VAVRAVAQAAPIEDTANAGAPEVDLRNPRMATILDITAAN
jgi:hypothetical protein